MPKLTNPEIHEQHMAWLRAVVANPPEGCAPWPSGPGRNGYRNFRYNGRMVGAHRVAYELANGPVPPGMHVLHRCIRCRHCCNPRHLYAGTHEQNMADRDRDGTTARGDRSGSRMHPERVARGDRHSSKTMPHRQARGERINTAKLTEAQVVAIRQRVAQGSAHTPLAVEFGVSVGLIGLIVKRKCWKHVP